MKYLEAFVFVLLVVFWMLLIYWLLVFFLYAQILDIILLIYVLAICIFHLPQS